MIGFHTVGHMCGCTAFADAFKLAAEADPIAQLCINDLSLIEAHNSPELTEQCAS